MPKKYLDADKREWLKLYESGKTEKWIADKPPKCDLRTVRRGIEEARRKQDVKVARIELLKEALRKHQDSLFEELDEMLSSLAVPPEDFAVLSWHCNGDSIFPKPETTTEQQTGDVSKPDRVSESQGEAMRGLLKEHLKHDRLWKVLAQYKEAYPAHLTARIALQRKTVTLLEEKTGYKLVDKHDVPPPFLCSYTTGDLFFRAVLQHAFGTHKSIDLEGDIVANTATGDVRYHGSILANAPGNEEGTKINLLDALRELMASSEAVTVVGTYNTLKETVMKTGRVVEQIKLLGLIPGQCKICRRLGM